MRIINHGNRYELGQIICPECECEFVYNKDDLHTEEMKDEESYISSVVFCPECNYRFVLTDTQETTDEGEVDI